MWNFNTNRADQSAVTGAGLETSETNWIFTFPCPGVHPVYSSDWADHSISPIAGSQWPGHQWRGSHPTQIRASGQAVVSTKGALDWVHFWQLCCNEEPCLLRALWLSRSRLRIKSGLWLGLLKISREELCPNCKYPVISLAILSLWSGTESGPEPAWILISAKETFHQSFSSNF